MHTQALAVYHSSVVPAEGVKTRNRLIDNEIRVLKEEANRLNLELSGLKDRVKENKEKIKLNNQLPYLVANIVEVLEVLSSELLTPTNQSAAHSP